MRRLRDISMCCGALLLCASPSALSPDLRAAEVSTAAAPADVGAKDVAVAPETSPVPSPRRVAATGTSAALARDLAREGARLFAQALDAEGVAQASLFAQGLERFDRIVRDHPDDPLAQDVREGLVGMIDVHALRVLVERQGDLTLAAPEEALPFEPRGASAIEIFDNRASLAALLLCGGAGDRCAGEALAAARSWRAGLAEDALDVVETLMAPPPPVDAEREAATLDAAARLAAFDALFGQYAGGAVAGLSAAFADLSAQTVLSAPKQDAAAPHEDAAETAATVFLTLAASAALGVENAASRDLASATAAIQRSAGVESRSFARRWAASIYTLELLRRTLAGNPAWESLHLRSARQHADILNALATGELGNEMLGADAPRPMTRSESDFLQRMLDLDAATRASLVAEAPTTPPEPRAEALESWLDAHAVAVSGLMLAADQGSADASGSGRWTAKR
ncbi:MAG: hypothetical protein ACFCUS_11640 [Rubrimonas sp.]|uniref:hypothetical protein n=1 Tax=Rubrimonas sp. TaxID=2036015 RepID=UPI002FDEC523